LRDADFDYAVISNSRHFINESQIISRLSKQSFMYGEGRKIDLIQYNQPTDACNYSNILYEAKYNRDYTSYILANYVISKSLLIRTLDNFLRDINLFENNPFDEVYYHTFLYTLLKTATYVDICSDKDVIKLVPVESKLPDNVFNFMSMLMDVTGSKIDKDNYKRKLLDASKYI